MLKQTTKVFCLLSALYLGALPALAQSRSSSDRVASFENRAISSAQKMSASELDEALPDRPFVGWLNKTIGPDAGVIWQLTECGKPIGGTDEMEQDLPACAEVNAKLADGRRVFVAISVGTFKTGLAGKPSFFLAVIELNERLYPVRRLSDLPEMLRATEGPSATGAKNRTADLPAIKMDSAWFISPFRYLGPMFASVPPVTDDMRQAEEPPPSVPPPSTQALEQVPESVSLRRAITKVDPDYTPTAKEMNVTEIVEVEIIISETGLVVEATAISGQLALRGAAVEAASKWVFEPAILNGRHVKVKSVLTFVFAPGAE